MKKKLLTAAACCMLIGVLICGCGSGSSEPSEKQINNKQDNSESVGQTSNSDNGTDWDEIKANLGACYAGITSTDDEYAYVGFNKAGDWGIIVFYDSSDGTNIAIAGDIVVDADSGLMAIQDTSMDLQLGFEVHETGDGTYILDCGDVGTVTLGEITPSELVECLAALDEGTVNLN